MSISSLFKAFIFGTCVVAFSGCQAKRPDTRDKFFENIRAHCGKAYAGKLVSDDEVDADFETKTLIMHVRSCESETIRIPFYVDDDRSRTWVISKTQSGLRLKHDHRHKDGTEDAVTQYGGDTADEGTANSQDFPVDDFSKTMFREQGLSASTVNIWSIDIDDANFTYQMRRPNRLFRVEFDLSKPLDNVPPAPWGS